MHANKSDCYAKEHNVWKSKISTTKAQITVLLSNSNLPSLSRTDHAKYLKPDPAN